LSAELSLHNNHYLLYKISKDFFRNRPDIFEISASEFYKYAKENGVVVIQAHPLRDGSCVPEPDCVDGFEVINTNPRHENFDDEILALAKKYKKPMTAGSDAHRIEDIGASGVLTEKEICSVDDYLDMLFSGGLKLIRGEEIL
jgi:predicted metal-dependent phosphoesterase TrpH